MAEQVNSPAVADPPLADSLAADRTVADLMSRRAVVVWPDTAIADVALILDTNNIGGVPVVDWSGYLVGIVSQMDLLRVRASESLWAQWPGLEARHVMSNPVFTVTADTTIREAARLMQENAVHRLVVVDDDGESPIGVLSAGDLVGALVDPTGG